MSKRLDKNYKKLEVLHMAMRCLDPEKKQRSFDQTEFRRHLFKSEAELKQMISNVDYSKISTFVYRDILKRKKLWGLDRKVVGISEQGYQVFLDCVNNTVDFLAVRENQELFSYLNEFYNLILKSIYLISLSYKERLFAK